MFLLRQGFHIFGDSSNCRLFFIVLLFFCIFILFGKQPEMFTFSKIIVNIKCNDKCQKIVTHDISKSNYLGDLKLHCFKYVFE